MTEKQKYTPEDYIGLDIGEYRIRFPEETKNLTDEQLFNLVMGTEDDLDDSDWREVFTKAA